MFTLPSLEYLDIKGIQANFEDLSLMAKHMPKLQHLQVGWLLLLSSWPEELDLPRDNSSLSPCYIDSALTIEEDLDAEVDDPEYNELDNIARYIFLCWCDCNEDADVFSGACTPYGQEVWTALPA